MQRERRAERKVTRLNESPSQKEGKYLAKKLRKYCHCCSLNESPSQKEGKYAALHFAAGFVFVASMKVPPKRKGNSGSTGMGA